MFRAHASSQVHDVSPDEEAVRSPQGPTSMPAFSPWGRCQSHTVLAPGIVKVTTASHGGIHLDEWRERQMPPALAGKFDGWYEEDVCACLPIVAFSNEFPAEVAATALNDLRHELPDLYERHFDEVIPPGASRTKDQQQFYRTHADDYLGCSAWSAQSARERFHVEISDDQVLLIACKGMGLPRGEVAHPLPEAVYLVDKDRYAARTNVYVIDPAIDIAVVGDAAHRCLSR